MIATAEETGMNIAEAIERFEKELPGWWWSIGNCSVSADASCGPDSAGLDAYLLADRIFDSGFDMNIRQPATVVDALMGVLEQAKAAKADALRRQGGGA